ncbi:MAG: SDR family oxidoreductase [Prevotellaceae bacterium]|jgi:NAD(P)-dependent dehydrogenase (short-subunit alcohol dehydrogenase family)|nr:SDR family oxidoreductase [Prevotellaceae bacterium]
MYNPFSLKNKTIFVTGAASGIGRTTALECSKLGACLVIVDCNKEGLLETLSLLSPVPYGKHLYFVIDLEDVEEIEKLANDAPAVDGLVNNAGIGGKISPIQFINEGDLKTILSINTVAPILLTQKLYKKKKINKGGSIVFTASIAGLNIANAGNTLYGVSKSGINAFMKGAALEMAAKKIRCNTINPGTINTPLISRTSISQEDREKDKAIYPLKRYGNPIDVALGIIYLLSDASSWVTGIHLTVDGGRSLI